MSTSTNKPAAWFWIVSVISLVWNLMGVMTFMMQVMMSPEALQAMSEAERSLYTDIPMWSTITFGVAVFGDTFGSILLLLRKKLATLVFTVSIAFTLATMFYTLVLSDVIAVRGASSAIFPIIIIIVGFLLIWFSRVSTAKGWLN